MPKKQTPKKKLDLTPEKDLHLLARKTKMTTTKDD